MSFSSPWFLVLLPLVVALPLALRGSLVDMTRPQRMVCLVLRGVILLLLILALAGIRINRRTLDLAVLYLVDDSASIAPESSLAAKDFIRSSLQNQQRGDVAGVVSFAREAQVREPLQPDLPLSEEWPVSEHRDATNLAGAIRFGSAVFPPGAVKRMIILSDGNATGEDATEAARQAAATGIAVSTVPLRNPVRPEVLVERVEAPRRVKSGEPFTVTAHLRSTVETKVEAKLYLNQFLTAETTVDVEPGHREITFPNLSSEASFISAEVEILPDSDTQLENNRARAAISLGGEPHVLIVEHEPDRIQPLAAALEAEKLRVQIRGENGLPRTLEDLQQFDLFILSDVSALSLSRKQMELYRAWVQDFGGGFLMLGGENSFGVGGYFRTPVEQMLPVRMEHDDRQETPSVALLVVLDRSGSMSAPVQGQTKMALADQGAVYAMEVLQTKDLFGLLAVDSRVHNVVQIGPLTNKEAVKDRIMAINAGGGGIYIYTSLLEAYQQLRDVNARIKHVILFSDAKDAEEKSGGEMSDGTTTGGTSFDVVSAMFASRITTSVVALGFESDKDTEFLKQLAARGNGRFYLTSDALTLPQIFSTETMKVAQSSLFEEPFAVIPVVAAPATAGIPWEDAPLLLGCNTTKPKPTGDVLLATERGDPLLATWRYGLGQVAAFTSDAKSRWAAEWLQWPGYGKFWTQLVRSLIRSRDVSGFQVNTRRAGRRLDLTIDAVAPDGAFRNDLKVSVNAVYPDQKTVTVSAAQTAPGRYEAGFDLPDEGTVLFAISSGNEPEYVFGYTLGYPEEYLSTSVNEEVLRGVAAAGNGGYDPQPAEAFSRPSVPEVSPREISPWFLALSLLLFPVDIFLRRRNWAR